MRVEREVFSKSPILVIETEKGRIAFRVQVEEIDISALRGFAESRFVDHAKLEVRAGIGLRGGGALTQTVDLELDSGRVPARDGADAVLVHPLGRLSMEHLNALLHHARMAGVVDAEHIDHSKVSVSAGIGLEGGGDLTSPRSLRLDLSNLDVGGVDAEDSLPFVTRDGEHFRVPVSDLFALFKVWLEREVSNAVAS